MKAKRHNRIQEVLIEKGSSAKELAKALRRPKSVIAQWCDNEIQPQLNTLAKIADYLDVDIRELLASTKPQ